MKPLVKNFRSEKGMTSIMMVVLLPVIAAFLGLAVDAGNIVMTKIRLQNCADAAALSAITDIENSSLIARSVVEGNGLDPDALKEMSVVRGTWDGETKSFIPDEDGNALRVRLAQDVPIYFLRIVGVSPEKEVNSEATASLKQVGAVVGLGATTVATNPDEGVLNPLLGNLLGTSVSLSAAGWEGLANAKLDLIRFLNVAKADLAVADVDGVLDAQLSIAKLLSLMIDVLENNPQNAAAVSALNQLIGQIGTGSTIKLGDMLQLDPSSGALAKADVNLLSMVMATAQLFNHTSGILVMTDVPLPGLLDLDLKVKIIEAPVIKIMKEGDTIHSAGGARIYLNAQGPSSLTGSPVIHLPLYLELGAGDATLTGISEGGVDMQISSSLSKLFVGNIDETFFFTDETLSESDFTSKKILDVSLLFIGLIQVNAKGYADAQGAEQSHTFTSPFPESVSIYGDAGSAVGNLLGSLDLTLTPTVLGILPLPTIRTDVLGIMSPLLEALLNPVSELTGAHLGRTDVTVYDYAYEAALVN